MAASLLLGNTASQAQILTPVKWSYAAQRTSPAEATVYLRATLDEGWHVYSQTGQKGGPIKTTITFTPAKGYALVGTPQEPAPVTKYEPVFEKSVIFQQRVKLVGPGVIVLNGSIHYMTCNEVKYLPPATVAFNAPLK